MAYLRSRANLSGSVCALAVLLGHLFNFIGPGWWYLAIGAYVGGSLPFLFGQPKPQLTHETSTAEALEHLRDEIVPKLPSQPRRVLEDIIKTVEALMPRLKEMESQGLVESSNRAMLKQTLVQLLPDCANSYLRLPPEYANQVAVQGKKTAQDLLLEQLHLLQEHVEGLEANLLSSEVNKLLANGRFLQEKLRPPTSPLD